MARKSRRAKPITELPNTRLMLTRQLEELRDIQERLVRVHFCRSNPKFPYGKDFNDVRKGVLTMWDDCGKLVAKLERAVNGQ